MGQPPTGQNTTSPLIDLLGVGEPDLLWYGPEQSRTPVVARVDEPTLEYAAIRRTCGLFDLSMRGTIEVTGGQRLAFLDRMLTQDLKPLGQPGATSSFWLNRKGRIDADLRLIETGSRLLLGVDRHLSSATAAGIEQFVFSEDVSLRDASDRWHWLWLHGPSATEAIARCLADNPAQAASVRDLGPTGVCQATIAGASVVIARSVVLGERGVELVVPREHASAVAGEILRRGGWAGPGTLGEAGAGLTHERGSVRPVGWLAVNTARIEAGTPMFNVDFGAESLPHETGVLDHRVSFTKGCYLGQEVVARMQSRGHPKQILRALRPEGQPPRDAQGIALQPVTGAAVREAVGEAHSPGEQVVGAVTSSALGPMVGGEPVVLAMVRWSHHVAGTMVWTEAESSVMRMRVQDSLASWRREG